MNNYDLTILVPVYNERNRLDAGLRDILALMEQAPFSTELLVVDDGSTDGTAVRVAETIEGRDDCRLIEIPENRGKGHAVKVGMLAAAGDVRLFTDIDLSVPIDRAADFLRRCQAGADVVIGTRKVAASQVTVHQPRHRAMLGEVFRRTTRWLFTPGLSDITCGFKAFRAAAAESLYDQSVINRWSFDAEILFLALRYDLKIEEVPVLWENNPETKVRLVIDLPRSLLELLRVRWRWARGGYRAP
ncbi:MAG: glycosyltransferase [Candidatus Lernaella stagnicola]|nr:glycosyltransferase [Candidatus Lernaella stagnicola]